MAKEWELAKLIIDAKKNVDSMWYIAENVPIIANINLRDREYSILQNFYVNCCAVLDKSFPKRKKKLCAEDTTVDRRRKLRGLMVDIYVTQKKYNIIYADPPWEYNKRKNKNTRFGGGAGGHYDIMNLQEIRNLPVQKISENDCALFLWVTFPKLKEQLDVFESWGFKYVTLGFSWIKTYKKSGTPCFGIGYYTKSNCEVCLLGIKGKLKPITNTISRCIISERREHSRKPDEVRERIVQLFGNLPRIELFARQKQEGWDCWGNDTNIIRG